MEHRDVTVSGRRQQTNEESEDSSYEAEGSENEVSESLIFETTNPNQATRFDLKQVFLWKDLSPTYFANGQFWEAFGVLDGRYKMDAESRSAPFLLDYCASLMITNRDYAPIKNQLKLLLIRINPTSAAVFWLAKKLTKLDRPFASLIMFEICYEMFFDVSKPIQASTLLEDCISGMKYPVSKMVKKEENLDLFVRRNILPKMYAMKQTLAEIDGINQQYKCVKTAWVTHGIEICESNDKDRIKLISETMDYMRETLGEQVFKHQIFGTLCLNVGSIHRRLGLTQEAAKYYKEAIDCFNSASDFETDDSKRNHLKNAKEALTRVEGLQI